MNKKLLMVILSICLIVGVSAIVSVTNITPSLPKEIVTSLKNCNLIGNTARYRLVNETTKTTSYGEIYKIEYKFDSNYSFYVNFIDDGTDFEAQLKKATEDKLIAIANVCYAEASKEIDKHNIPKDEWIVPIEK